MQRLFPQGNGEKEHANMKKSLSVLIAAALLVLLMAPALAVNIRGVNPGDTLYVIGNAKLNVRQGASPTAKIIYRLPVNSPVIALDEYANGYLRVEFKFKGKFANGYVSVDYLDTHEPSHINTDGAIAIDDPQPNPTAKPAAEGELVSHMDFRYFKLIGKDKLMIIAAKPSRPGGWVNLRWVPSFDSEIICKMMLNEEMTVIAEGKTWYQVMNAQGYVGFIYKQYTTVVYYGDDRGDGVGAQQEPLG